MQFQSNWKWFKIYGACIQVIPKYHAILCEGLFSVHGDCSRIHPCVYRSHWTSKVSGVFHWPRVVRIGPVHLLNHGIT